MTVLTRIQGIGVASTRSFPWLDGGAAEVAHTSLECVAAVPPQGFPSRTARHWRPVSRSSSYDDVKDRGVVVYETDQDGPDGPWLIRFGHEMPAECLISPDGASVTLFWAGRIAEPDDGTLPQDLASLFLGPVLALVARRLGRLPLHAAAVVSGGEAILMSGPSGAGKSTLLAAFARDGCPVLADDQAILDETPGGFCVHRGQDGPRLLPDTLAKFGLDPVSLPRVWSIAPKRRVVSPEFPVYDGAGSLPVGRILLLGPRTGSGSPALRRVPPVAALPALEAMLHPAFLPPRPWERAALFRRLARILREVPVLYLERPDRWDALGATRDLARGPLPS